MLLDYKQSGLGVLTRLSLDQNLKENANISDIQSQLQQHISHENGGVWFTEQKLYGVPPDDLARWVN